VSAGCISSGAGAPLLSSFLLLWLQDHPCLCSTEVPESLLAVNQGYFLFLETTHIPHQVAPPFFLFLTFIVLLFICTYNTWVISPPCPHPLPYHPLRPLSLPPHPLDTRQKLFCPYL
jgi:hypothetical protein